MQYFVPTASNGEVLDLWWLDLTVHISTLIISMYCNWLEDDLKVYIKSKISANKEWIKSILWTFWKNRCSGFIVVGKNIQALCFVLLFKNKCCGLLNGYKDWANVPPSCVCHDKDSISCMQIPNGLVWAKVTNHRKVYLRLMLSFVFWAHEKFTHGHG